MSSGPTAEKFERLDRLFHDLIDASDLEREERLSALAESDPELHEELRAMLDEAPTERVHPVGIRARTERESSTLLRIGTELGRFTLLRPIGAGGMGEVWEASQSEPVVRRVAVKVLLGSASAGASRFRAERQALATMEHPNIARVFDGGETPEGQPYFVMELVDGGVPLTRYCEDEGLELNERLALFLPVCEAIEHAHRKRIIHRDLKPSNVLVANVEGRAVPKVIDFGIAKPLDVAMAAETTAATRLGELVGTPEYMSPEQASLGEIDIDTRSDVYTLGLLLYETVVGELPTARSTLKDLSFGELCRVIRDEEAPRPSTRVRQIGGTLPSGTTWRRLQGDLDRILTKALAKDRDQRYGSAEALGEDIRRFLANEPVLATPPSWGYQAKKFFGRNRIAVAFGALALLSLVAALFGTTFGMMRAREAEAVAQVEAQTATRVATFLEDLLREGNPEEAKDRGMSVKELVALGGEKLQAGLVDEPEVRSRLLVTVADAQMALGEYAAAVELLDETITLRERLFGEVSAEVEQALDSKSEALSRSGQLDAALEVATRQKTVADAVYEVSDAARWNGAIQLGMVHWRRGDFAAALAMLEEALDQQQAARGMEHAELPSLLNNVAILYWQNARYDEAAELYDRALKILRRDRGEEHPHVASTLNNLALVSQNRGDSEAGREANMQALTIRRKIFEAPHPDIAESLNNLGTDLFALGETDEAIAVTREALEMRREIFESPNDYVATSLFNLGRYQAKQDSATARRLVLEAKAMFEATLGPDHLHLSYIGLELSNIAMLNGDYATAVEHAERAVEIVGQALGPDHPRMRAALTVQLRALEQSGSSEAAAVRSRLNEFDAANPAED